MTSSALLAVPFVSTVPSASAMPVVFVLLNKSPVPSSLMVPTPDTEEPPLVVATRLNVSEVSKMRSFVIATRTNKLV